MKKLFAALFAIFIFLYVGCSDVSNGNVFEKLVVLQNQNSSSEEKIELSLDFSRTIWPESFSSALNSIDFESLNWDITFKVSSLNTYADARDFSISNRGFITKNVTFNIDGQNRTEPIPTLEVNAVKKGIYDVYVSTVYQGKKIYGTANSVDLASLKTDSQDPMGSSIDIRLFSDLTEGSGDISDFHVHFFEANGWNFGTANLSFSSNVTGETFENLGAKLVSMGDSNAEEIALDVTVDYLIAGSNDSNGLQVADTTLVANLTGSNIPSGYYELVLSWNSYKQDGNSDAIDLTPISLNKYLVCIDAEGTTKVNDIEAYYSRPETIILNGYTYYAKMDPACKGTGKYANAPAYFWDLFKFIYKNRAENSSVIIFCDDFYLDIAKYNEVKASMDPNYNLGYIEIKYPKGSCSEKISIFDSDARAEYFEVTNQITLRNSSESVQKLENLCYGSTSGTAAQLFIADKDIELKLSEHGVGTIDYYSPSQAYFIFNKVKDYIDKKFITAYANLDNSDFISGSKVFAASDGDYVSSGNYCITQTGSETIDSKTYYYAKIDTQGVVKFKEVDFELSGAYATDSATSYKTGAALPYKDGSLKFTVVSDTLNVSKIESITWKVNGITKQTGTQQTYSVQTSALNKKSSNIVDCIIKTSFGKYSSAFEFKFDESGLKPADMTNKKIYLDGKQLKLYKENAEDRVLLSGVGGQTRYWIPGDGYIYAFCNGTLGIWQLMEDESLKQYTVSSDFVQWQNANSITYIYDICYSPKDENNESEDSHLYLLVKKNGTSTTSEIYAVPTLISGTDYIEPESVKSSVDVLDGVTYVPNQITIARDYNGYKVILLALKEEFPSDNNGFYFWEWQLYANNNGTDYSFSPSGNTALSSKNYKLNTSYSANKYEVTDLEYVNGKAYALCSEFNIGTAPYFNYGSIVEISIGTSEADPYEISYTAYGVPEYESQDEWPTIKSYDNTDNPALMPALVGGNVNTACFYNPLRFVAIKEDELLIADRVIYQKASPNKGELEDASRFVNFNLASHSITGTVTGIKLSGIGCVGTWNVK